MFLGSGVGARKAGGERMVPSYLQEVAEKHKGSESEFEKVFGGRDGI